MVSSDFLRVGKKALPVLLLVAVVFLTYVSVLRNGFVVWDDDSLVYENPLVTHLNAATVKGIFTSYDPELYIPLTLFSFQVEHALFGFDPFFYHFTNLLLHCANTVLVFFLLQRLGLKKGMAFFLALLFGLHPINSEAVAWVSARKDLLAACFFLGSLSAYLNYLSSRSMRWYWGAFLLFLCALLSKVVVLFLPLVLLLIDWRQGRRGLSVWREKWPFFLLSAVFLIVALFGKTQNIASLSLWQTLLLSLKSTAFSLWSVLWPWQLSLVYQQSGPIQLASVAFLLSTVTVTLLAALTLWSLHRTKVVAFAMAWYVLLLLPTFSNFSKAGSYFYFSDRYVYLPQIGLLLLLGITLEHLAQRGLSRVVLRSGQIVSVLLLLCFGWTAHGRTLLWHDSETLFRDALSKNPQSAVMHFNMAVVDQKHGNLAEAEAAYRLVLAKNPHYAKAHNNLGLLLAVQGKTEEARREYEAAIASDPQSADALNNLGSWYMDRGEIDRAIVFFQQAIAADAHLLRAYYNLGASLGKQERYEEALEVYAQAFAFDPSRQQEYEQLKRALQQVQQ